uniref:NADH-ubiquinone oxidoreductase chain 4L n=2 Tax=Tanystylum orbiculare TaxID=88027 RepID=E0XLE9_TANOR|nr:NADH dehydrogenase subunit 4L [Tanystylum orbiculare]ADB91994.1 NADH dehydrogenase subunit 4L [Tanystylum orbiculare]
MIMSLNFIIWFILFLSMTIFFTNFNYILCLLLSLEFMMLMIFMVMCSFIMNYSNDYMIGLFYLTIAVCDGGLGLSTLIMIIRYYGNDQINSFVTNM